MLAVPTISVLEVFKRISQPRDDAKARSMNAIVWTRDADSEGLDGVQYRPRG